MSEQIGFVKLKGKIDGISFYERDGKHLARMARGPSKEKIARDPRFARTRENNNEFRGCMAMVRNFRLTFISFLSAADSHFTGRLTAIIKEINKNSRGKRGNRAIEIAANRIQFINLDFNIHRKVTDVFTGMMKATRSDDRKYASITIDNVLVKRSITAPEGATHVQFTQVIGIVSDFAIDPSFGDYAQLHNDVNKHSQMTNSDFIALNTEKPLSIILKSILEDEAIPGDGVSVMQCFYIAFYERVDGKFKLIQNNNAFKILDVY